MAGPTKTKIYTFGDRKLDYGKYITNLENNVESYLQNQRDTEGWDDARAQEFRNAFGEIISNFRGDYEGDGTRFSTNQMGAIMDSLGVLNNTDSDDFYYNKKGEQIDRATYDALKDKKRRKYSSFEANREVAEYFRRIGSYMKDYEDTTEKFDLSKHGFNKWLMDREAPGGTFNYLNYWDLDPADATTGKRDTKNRVDLARRWMKDYIADISKRTDLSFEGNKSFSSLDDYVAAANRVAEQWNNKTWDANDKIAAQRLGIDNDFMTKFFGTEGDPALSNEENAEQKAQREQQAKIEQELKSEEDRQAAYRKWVDEQVASHTNMKYPYSKNAPYYTNLFSWDRYYKDGQPTEEYDRLLGNLVVTTADGHRKAINQMTEQEKGKNLGLLLNKYVNNLYNPRFNPANIPVNNHYMYLILLLNSHYAQDLGNGSYYIPSTKLSNTALIFDSNAKTLYHTFIGDLPDIWELRKKAYWDKVNGTSPNAAYYEEGGIIKAQDGSALLNQAAMKYFADRASKREEQLATKALAKNRTIEQLTAAERKAHAPFAGFELDNTWSTEEYARFGGALADITAAISAFVPGYGTAVSGVAGIGSTLANFGADWADDSVSAGLMWKNFGVNLGMDVLGLVPYGGAAGKFTKIARNIGKYIPRLMAVIGTSAALQNKDEILGSFKKALNDPANLTVGDWQNISQGIGVATGLTAGAGRAVLKKAKETNSSTDFAAIRLQSRSNPKNKVNKIVSAKTAADLRAATTNDEIRLILKRDHPHLLENYDIDIKGGLYGKELTFSPSWKDKSLIKTKEPLARIYEVRRDSKGNLYGYNGKWKSDLALYTTHGKAKQQYRKSSLTTGTMPWGERDAYLRDFNKVRRFTSEDADFQDARWKSEDDFYNTPHKKSLLEDANTRRANEVEYQKPFRDEHGTTADIQKRLADARAYSKSPEYQTAVDQHATLTQQHADLVARHQPVIDTYKQQLKQIDDDLLFYRSQATASSASDRNLANREIRRLSKLRDKIQAEHDTLAKELADSETKVKLNSENVKKGSDERIKELEDLEFKSKFHDESMKKLDDEINRLQQLGGKHTPAYLELLLKRAKDGKITFTDERNQQFTVDAARALRLAGIRKHGGLLKAVEKFQDSGKIKSPMRDVLNKGNVNWYTDMFTNGLNASKTGEDGAALPNWFDQWKVDNIDQFNQLQTDWYNNLQATGYQEGSNKAVRNPGVKTRQPNWDNTGGNAPIAEMLKPGPNGEAPRLVGNGGTEDKPDENGKFGADGVFGQQEFLRHAGRASDWEGKDAELAEFNKKLSERGIVYEKDRSGKTDMMMLYPLDKKPEEKSGEKPEEKKASSVIPPGKKKQDDKSQSPSILAKVNGFLGNPEVYSISRLFNTLGQIDREVDLLRQKRPHLNNVVDNHLYVRKDNYALYNARRALENLMHMASQPVTSDGAQARTFYGDNFVKVLDYGLLGNLLADAKYWETSDASKQHEIAKQEERNKNANENGRTLAEHAHDMITTQQVADYKKTTALNNYLYEKQYRLEEKYNDAQAALKAANRIILDNDITTNLSKYAKQFNISSQEIAVWDKVQSGTLPTSLSKEEKALWESVYRKVQVGKTLMYAQQQGADISNFALVRNMSKDNKSTSPTAYTAAPEGMSILKSGGKAQAKARVKVARIREKMKNADRTARAIEKDLDRVLKTVESINKRMYGIKR